MRERDMILIEITGEVVKVIIGPTVQLDAENVLSYIELSKDRFGVALVGKDTGVKLRSNEVVTASSLFALIDSMPMRKREIQGRAKQ